MKRKSYSDKGIDLLNFFTGSGRNARPAASDTQETDDLQEVLDDGLDALLDEYDALDRGFKRRERLDVKKPGPFFSTNNYAFQHAAEEEDKDKQVKLSRPCNRL